MHKIKHYRSRISFLSKIPIFLCLLFIASASFSQASMDVTEIGEAGLYTLDTSGVIFPFTPYPQDSSSVYAVGAYPLTTEPLPTGERQEIVQSYCSMCHSTTIISLQPKFSLKTWRHEVEKMKQLGAQIPEEMISHIIEFLEKSCSVNEGEK
ncbi:cytochrome C [Methylacidiphilum sp. Yel]|uniref:cytochrome C n=1 Tax=Methylacidiphilum sp. Yel TaxID=1847730 RepID=UPI00106D243B|nr:cytochrome C [Methylacidiphilum sp. Yel]TFE69382.1 cytochrome C [Methylacidiphilum sp. Yel]